MALAQSKIYGNDHGRLGRAALVGLIVIFLAGSAAVFLIRGNHGFFMKNKSFYLISRGLYPEALGLLHTLHQKNPTDPTILQHMLIIHNHLRDNGKALVLAKQLKNMGKPSKEVYWAFGIYCLLTNDLNAAKENFSNFPIAEPLSRTDRDPYRIPFVQGIIAFIEQDYESAEQFLMDALDKDDDIYLTHLYLAKTYIDRGKTDQAKDFLRQTTARFPEQAEPYLLLASLYYHEADMDRTRFYLDNAQFRGLDAYKMFVPDTSSTSSLHAYEDCGICFRQLVDGRLYSPSIAFARKLERIYGEILLYLRMGRYQEAKERLEKLCENHPEVPGAYYLMALIAEQTNAPDKAKNLLYREVEINPWNYNAYLKWQQLSPGASDSQTSPALMNVRRNLEERTVVGPLGKSAFVFDKENNSEVKALVSNGRAQTTINVPRDGMYLLTIIARGEPAGGIWPLMYVKVDESGAQAFYADSTDWRAYSIPVNIRSGSHTVEIAFANDMIVKIGKSEEDCNLFIDRALLLCVPPREFLDNWVAY